MIQAAEAVRQVVLLPGDTEDPEAVLLEDHRPPQEALRSGSLFNKKKERFVVGVNLKNTTIKIKLIMFHCPHHGQALPLHSGISALTG